jgi:hypothetical protein
MDALDDMIPQAHHQVAQPPSAVATVASLWVGIGVVVFYSLHSKFHSLAPFWLPKSSSGPDSRVRWRWTNIATSCVHAAVTGVGALLS